MPRRMSNRTPIRSATNVGAESYPRRESTTLLLPASDHERAGEPSSSSRRTVMRYRGRHTQGRSSDGSGLHDTTRTGSSRLAPPTHLAKEDVFLLKTGTRTWNGKANPGPNFYVYRKSIARWISKGVTIDQVAYTYGSGSPS